MTNPYNPARDSNADPSDYFGDGPTVADVHVSAARDNFDTNRDQLSEYDYRDEDFRGGPNPDFQTVRPRAQAPQEPQRFTYPTPNPGGRLGDLTDGT